MQKFQGRVCIALTDALANDCLLRSGHADENVLMPFIRISWRRTFFCFLPQRFGFEQQSELPMPMPTSEMKEAAN
jgi:hypothetical protein